ncbi:hypothetical protein CEUSTIGMA_g1722.t1 [Chlamydomonas eustigma]|uniref:USP domain-containing protein n=1 Tax=Chlamydomonas eustigma TaxID=1157962 RepID=A0A250WTX5_9CHLO|nr:hypothetical protein CEUSTIGMA_g1722.t1 [Chlamydomonas eustigma]|eukprot:GAX74273.1 hypothetical protein CEUSTIGMA_g1722.t1 [Chlamydomonas eustigma]
MANKKGAKNGKSGKGNGKPGPQKPVKQQDLFKEQLLTPQERVDTVRPLWESLSQQERIANLSVDVDSLRQRACQITELTKQQQAAALGEGLELITTGMDRTMEEVLDEGVQRLKDKSTWKLWTWMPDNEEFYEAEAFRAYVTEKHIREDLRKLLPRDDPKAPEKPAEEAFRQRMVALLQKVQQSSKQAMDENGSNNHNHGNGRGHAYRRRLAAGDSAQATRDTNVELINVILENMEKEHECLYQSMLQPVIAYVMEVLPEPSRDTARAELAYEDLQKLPPEDTAQIVEWLTEKVDALSTKLKADPKEEEEEDDENMGDVDLWSLVNEGKTLTVNEKWLQHLQDRLLGDDGHPRKTKAGEDPFSNGLVLEWVYGSIVSTAEKARDGAKRSLGSYMPSVGEAYAMLLRGLEDQFIWDTRGKQAKELMSEMLKSRIEAQELARQYEIRPLPKPTPGSQDVEAPPEPEEPLPLPDSVIVSMLRREALLTKAKLHCLVFEHMQQDKSVRTLKSQLKQGEPEFERLKRELDEVKNAHRGLDGTYRSAAEMERHRAQLADAAIGEQLEVQTAFREQGARLQGVYDKKQRGEFEMAKRETEIKQLQGWKGTVENLIDKFQEVLVAINASSAGDSSQPSSEAGTMMMEVDEPASDAGLPPTGSDKDDAAVDHKVEDVEMGVFLSMDVESKSPIQEKQPLEELSSGKPTSAVADGAGEASVDTAVNVDDGSNSEEACASAAEDHKEPWEDGSSLDLSPQQCMQLAKLRSHFHKDVRKQLYGETEDKQFFDSLKQEVKVIEKRLEESRVALQHLEMNLMNTGCDDPGALIGLQLALPILQDKLDARALEYAAERAKMAEHEIIQMEAAQREQEAAERERKLKAKHGKKEKVRSEKEKVLAEKASREAAEQERIAKEAAERREAEEAERIRRMEAMEQLRREEEESMERRRLELLSDENGYWRRRMEAEAKVAEVVVAVSREEDAKPAEKKEKEVRPSALDEGVADDEEGFVASRRRRKKEQEAAAAAQLIASQRQQQQSRSSHQSTGTLPSGQEVRHSLPPAMQNNVSSPPSSADPLSDAPTTSLPSDKADFEEDAAQQSSSAILPPEGVSGSAPNEASSHQAVAASSAASTGDAPPDPQGHVAAAASTVSVPLQSNHAAATAAQPATPPNLQALSPPFSPSVNGGVPGIVLNAPPPPPPMPPPTYLPHMAPQMMMALRPGMPPHVSIPMQQQMPVAVPIATSHDPRGMPHPMVMAGPPGPQGAYPGMLPHPSMMAAGAIQVMAGPNGPVFVYPPHLAAQAPQHLMGQMHPLAMQHGPALMPMPQQQQQQQQVQSMDVGAALTTSPKSAATTPKAPGKSGGLNVSATAFVPSSQQFPVPPRPLVPLQPAYIPIPIPVNAAGLPLYRPYMATGTEFIQQQLIPNSPQYKSNRSPRKPPPPPLQGMENEEKDFQSGSEQVAVDSEKLPQQPPPPLSSHLPMDTPSVRTSHSSSQGNGVRSAAKGSAAGCPPVSPKTPLDAAENSDGSANTDENMGSSCRQQGAAAAGSSLDAAHPTSRVVEDEASSALSTRSSVDADGVSHLSSDKHRHGFVLHNDASSQASSTSPPAMSKNPSWSSVAAAASGAQNGYYHGTPQAVASVSSLSPSSSSNNLVALASEATAVKSAVSSGGSWKQKLQHNLQHQPPLPLSVNTKSNYPSSRPGGTSPVSTPQATQQKAQQATARPSQLRNSPTSAAAMSEAPRPPPGTLRKLSGGRFEFVPSGNASSTECMPPSTLSLVCGLLNRDTENNCFLNVIVQALWHLKSFREPMLGLSLSAIQSKKSSEVDKRVMAAVWSMFKEISECLQARAAAHGSSSSSSNGGRCSTETSTSGVTPKALRAALCGQSSIHVDPSDMHDAGEVFAEILSMLHRAELDGAASAVQDLQLPVRVRVSATESQEGSAGASTSGTSLASPAHSAPFASALMSGSPSPLPAAAAAPATLIHNLFGLDVQLPCYPETEGSKGTSAGSKGRRSPPLPAPPHSVAKSPKGFTVEVQQYTKFFHLVAAQGLKRAAAAAPSASFEELLADVETSGHDNKLGLPTGASKPQETVKLLRRPAVFTVAVVWDSPQAPLESIRGTVEALGWEVNLAGVFSLQHPCESCDHRSSPHHLKSVVCYYGHHYQVFVLSEELKLWLVMDDEEAQVVGAWGDVCRTMVSKRLQPSLLFYEDSLLARC